MGIGKRIKEARENNGFTQNELAELIGVTGSAVTNYEKETSHPKEPVMYKLIDVLHVDANYLFQDVVNTPRGINDINMSEYTIIKKYRDLDPFGQETISIALDRESIRAESLKKLNTRSINVIEFQSKEDRDERIITYHRSASAGSGIYILGNEISDELAIPNTPNNQDVDYAIKVSGDSMYPDYCNEDIALVSQRKEMKYGDVGIFVKNGDTFIKEYQRDELVSRNPNAPNISVSDSDNVVCMGKVIGKL